MSAWLKTLFVGIFGNNSLLATFLISMIPIVELRGAIPFGASTGFWGENALSLWGSFGISLAGSSIICLILTFLFMPVFKWLKRTKCFKKLAGLVENKLKSKSKNVEQKTVNEKSKRKVLIIKIVSTFVFVAIPLPLTGVWTGTCLALFIGLNSWQTLCSVLSGNAIAGLLMTLISYFFKDNTSIVLYAFLILVGVFLIFELIKFLVKKVRNKKQIVLSAGEQSAELSQSESDNPSASATETETLAGKTTASAKETETTIKTATGKIICTSFGENEKENLTYTAEAGKSEKVGERKRKNANNGGGTTNNDGVDANNVGGGATSDDGVKANSDGGAV